MVDRKSVLLAAASTAVALLLCEAGLRIYRPFDASRRAVVAPAPPPGPSDLRAASEYARLLPVVPGTDRAWLVEDPPPLTSRVQPSSKEIERYEDFVRRKIYPPQAQYIWNRKFVDVAACDTPAVFASFPPGVPAFEPPSDTQYPRYRFPPSATLPSGLVTNRFGLRGPEIDLVKPPRTVRVAFVGASTTVHVHSSPFSYPERVGAWLNRFAQAGALDVRFEALNAGREGIASTDIAAIVREEVLPLDPDLVVYYEGANQFLGAVPGMAAVEDPRAEPEPNPFAWFREKTAVGDLLARTGVIPAATGEPPKPRHRLIWPARIDPRNPDPDGIGLPLDLNTVVRDLDAIRDALRPGGGRLLVSSFVWLAGEKLRISQAAHKHIWWHLNEIFAPLRYAEIRQLADFQNLVFRRYAETRGLVFLDVAPSMPQNPDLFVDAIHMREPGERLKAWIMFQKLVPYIRDEIAAGRLPRSAPQGSLPAPPSLEWRTVEVRCGATAVAK